MRGGISKARYVTAAGALETVALTIWVRLGGTGNHGARGSSGRGAATGADVAEQLAPGDGSLGLDERVDGPLEDGALSLHAESGIRAADDGLYGAGAEDKERGEHGGQGETGPGCGRVECWEVLLELDDEARHTGPVL